MKDRQPEPELGGATEALVHERASATPATQTATRGRASDGSAAPTPPKTTALRELEQWFVEAVTSPCDDNAVGDGARAVLTRGPKLEAPERLGIYRYAYRARLVECLIDDYPALQAALGAEAFEALCHEYIERHPSSSPSLNFFGRHMARFCLEESKGPFPLRAFAADLATLEWALVEVLHARTADALAPETLGAIPVERWSAARLPPSNALRVLRFAYPVSAFFHAFKMGEEPTVPAPLRSSTAVYRTDMTLWRMDLTPAMATLLEGLFRGETLGEALAKLEGALSEAEEAEAERSLMAWFREWVAAGFFARVELDQDVQV
jgi:hypothetical protein